MNVGTMRLTSAQPPRDLQEVAQRLRRHFRGIYPCGYLKGKTRIRNAVARLYGISAVDAERVVEELQARGFARYCGVPGALDHDVDPWTIESEPLSVS